MGWLFVVIGIVGILFARRVTQRVILLRILAVFILLIGIVLTAPPEPTKTSNSAASPVTSPPPAPQPEVKAPRGIGRSYFQLTAFPGVVFVERTSDTLVDGRARRLLMTPDKLAVFEVIGPPDDPASASLSLFIPNDNDALVLRNAGLAQLFLANVAPAWVDRNAWLTSALDRAVGSPDASQQVTRDGNTITVRYLQPLSMVSISVSPAP